jgi:prevent-host-death family protein
MPTVTAAELQKNFGHFRERAQAEPVFVTSYGKPSVVLLSAAEYDRLRELDRRAVRLEDMDDPDLEAMLNASIPAEHRYSLTDIAEEG